MVAVLLAPIYLLLNFYLLRWLLDWMGACHSFLHRKGVMAVVTLLYVFLCTSLLTSFLAPAGTLRRFLRHLSNYWLGTLLYTLLVVLIADLVRLLLRISRWIDPALLHSRRVFVASGAVCVAVILFFSVWGVIGAQTLHTTHYAVKVNKDGGALDRLRVVLAADLHLGYNIGCRQMERMVEAINGQAADLVVIAGDIFDNEYDALEDPARLSSILNSIESRYGVYACYGNHDIDEKVLAGFTFGGQDKKASDPRMDAFLEDAGITLLQDEGVLIDDSFYLYGRPDRQRPGRGILTRRTPAELTADMDQKRPILVLDHQPAELQELADAGVDLDLCGHTHDGQMFPANLTVRLMWENTCGYLKKGNMHNIVTSGVGLFGPNMRVATRSEICVIDVEFRK